MKRNIIQSNRPFQDNKHNSFSHSAFDFGNRDQANKYNDTIKYDSKSESERILREMRKYK